MKVGEKRPVEQELRGWDGDKAQGGGMTGLCTCVILAKNRLKSEFLKGGYSGKSQMIASLVLWGPGNQTSCSPVPSGPSRQSKPNMIPRCHLRLW
jgi:hypothetical protein